MSKTKFLILTAILLVESFYLNAQNTQMKLEECIQYALENNLQVRQQDLSVQLSEERLVQSKHNRYPNLNAFVGHNYNWGRSFDVFTNAPVTQRVQSNNFSLNSSVTIFNGFSISNTIKRNALDVESGKFDLEKQKNDLILNVVTAYLNVLFNKENLDNARRQLQNSASQIERTEKLVNAGVLPETTLFDLKSQNANDRVLVIQSENNLQLSKLTLKQLLQMDNASAQDFDIVVPTFSEPSLQTISESVNTIFDSSEGTLPEVRSADIALKSAELGVKIAQANYYPTLSLNGSISTFYSSAQKTQIVGQRETGEIETLPIGYLVNPFNSQQFPDLPNLPGQLPVFADFPSTELITTDFTFSNQLEESLRRNIGLSLSIPIYNRNQVKSSVANAQIQREQARVNSLIVRNQLRQTVETSYYDVLAAINTYDANRTRVSSLQETFRVTEQQYEAGSVNVTDYQVARNNLANAQADLIRAKYDLIFKRKILDFYLGKELKL